MLLRNTLLWLAANRLVKRAVISSPVAKPLARRFVAGETLDDAIAATRDLNTQRATVTLAYLGENVHTEAEAQGTATAYHDLLQAIAKHRLNCNISLKLTALGLDIDRAICLHHMCLLLEAAQAANLFVRIDMESSEYTQTTLDIFEELYLERGYRNTGIVLQSYLRRAAADTERAIAIQARVRLCKGAYNEPQTVAYSRKADVDSNYLALARRLLCDGNYPALATHDAAIIAAIRDFARQQNIPASRYEFQMLYGVRRDLQRDLISAGHNLRIYVPYGDAWYPYLMRRMAERPANLLFVLRSLRHG
jgi:proline dehydrogenase